MQIYSNYYVDYEMLAAPVFLRMMLIGKLEVDVGVLCTEGVV